MTAGAPARIGRFGLYAFLIGTALFFAIPLLVVISTSLKSLDEIRDFSIFVPPSSPDFARMVEGVVRRLHRPELRRRACRVLELGADPDPERDIVGAGRCAQRLCLVALAGAGVPI